MWMWMLLKRLKMFWVVLIAAIVFGVGWSLTRASAQALPRPGLLPYTIEASCVRLGYEADDEPLAITFGQRTFNGHELPGVVGYGETHSRGLQRICVFYSRDWTRD